MAKSKNQPKNAVKSVKVAGEKKAKVEHALVTKSFVGEAGLRVNVRLQTYNGKFTTNALFVAKGEKAQVGCRSWHATQEEAQVAFDKIVAQATKLGWHEPVKGEKPAKAAKKDNVGKFDLANFPQPVKITTMVVDASETGSDVTGPAAIVDGVVVAA
jgi:hypothetical protein